MLVLTRKIGDVIIIGDRIRVTVMSIRGKQVRLGIEADKSTSVHREEIYKRVVQETKSAIESGLSSVNKAKDILKTTEKELKKKLTALNSQNLLRRERYLLPCLEVSQRDDHTFFSVLRRLLEWLSHGQQDLQSLDKFLREYPLEYAYF